MEPRKILLIGCGSKRAFADITPGVPFDLVTLDIVSSHNPDVVWDLNVCPWPFESNSMDEIHGYEVLEHLGQQGDAESFFGTFNEIYRILKPGGILIASCPRWDSIWAWSDPSHRRVVSSGSLTYLDATSYDEVGVSTITDFRTIWSGDLEALEAKNQGESLFFMLKAHKPSRRANAGI